MAKKATSAKAPQILVPQQAKDKDQREAIDELQAGMDSEGRGKAAQLRLTRKELMEMPTEELEKIVKDHPVGSSVTGWKTPYKMDNPRSLMLEYQDEVSADASRFKAALQARQTGKDFESTEEVARDLFSVAASRWMIAAPSERQSLDSLGQCKLWCRAYALKIDDYKEIREGSTSEHLLKSAEVTLSNKSNAVAVPGRPETVRGKSASVLITEVDFLENAKETVRALLPSILNPLRGGEKKLRYISTPNGVGNVMHKTRESQTGKLQWSYHTVNILHAILMGLPVDYELMMEMFGDDHEGARQELLCEFLDSSNVLLPYDLIQMSESMEATEVWDPAISLSQTGPCFTGIDFGRQNDPTVAWTLQLVGGCLWTREVLVLQGMSTPDQEATLRDRVAASQRTCFDYTGPGIGLGDYLVTKHTQWKPEEHKLGKVELCTFSRPFKCEIFPRLRRAFEASQPGSLTGRAALTTLPVRVPVSRVIREDLHAMNQTIAGNAYNYWSPRTKNGHSDRCTALALAIRAAGEGFSGPFDFTSVNKKTASHGNGSKPRKRRRFYA